MTETQIKTSSEKRKPPGEEMSEDLIQQIAERVYRLFLQDLLLERERDGVWNDQITGSPHHPPGGPPCW